ncbi:GNAT family N-acetyltransferase [Sandarakinorhabdus sp.]|uniref:GNAT family N-acetyltransferase n=1 Tax=Sandarakinorhabdus sp. TaxID=1916663 RepID=UPI00286D9410|nr:GNAT family N-acetyltransferase [Sandarakinorhabdus sp.]
MIRFATPADIPAIHQLIVELAIYEKEPDAVKATHADLDRALFGERPVAECVLAEQDGQPVGLALFFTNFSTWTGKPGLYLEDLFVQPTARGSGTGKALLAHLAQICVARGYSRFEWSVLDWNTPAIGFYTSLGAKLMDGWTVMRLDGDALSKLAGTGDGNDRD